MFQELKNQEAEQKPDNQAFLALYAKFRAGAAWLAKREAQGLDNAPHLARFHQLEAQTDREWENMAEKRKEAILGLLAQNGGIPAEVQVAQEMFEGKLAEIT